MIKIRNKSVWFVNMIRNLVKFSSTSIPRINSSYFISRNGTCDFLRLNVPSVCSRQQNKCICSDATGNNLLRSSSHNVIKDCVRFKSKSQKSRTRQDDSDDEEEDEEVDEYDADGNHMRQMRIKSMRADNVLTKVMSLTRRKIDDLFLEAKFRYNGQRLPKKSLELKEGDTLEICTDPVDTGGTTEVVAKLNILKIKPMQELSTFYITYTIDKKK